MDQHLEHLTSQYGLMIYLILAAIIFAETAFVIFPFLPGDSLLFMIGVISAREKGGINVILVFLILTGAAILGNVVNYWIGKFFGEKLFRRSKLKIFSQENLDKTHAFFEKHGPKTIVVTRFVPVIRAFAPFVAGMGAMTFPKFMVYNVIGGVAWVGICTFLGYFLGNIPAVKENFELAIVLLVFLSVLPIIWEVISHKRKAKIQSANTES
jgi:membrane-associated protein